MPMLINLVFKLNNFWYGELVPYELLVFFLHINFAFFPIATIDANGCNDLKEFFFFSIKFENDPDSVNVFFGSK